METYELIATITKMANKTIGITAIRIPIPLLGVDSSPDESVKVISQLLSSLPFSNRPVGAEFAKVFGALTTPIVEPKLSLNNSTSSNV